MVKNQGQTANITGNSLENMVISTLKNKGFEVIKYNDYQNKPNKYGNELLLRHVPYTSIYEHKAKTEFLLLSQKYNLKIRIECKWQQVGGSVDEKFPYVYLNCLESISEDEIIILVDGKGAKLGAVEWLKNAAKNKLYTNNTNEKKNITVMNMTDFMIWTNKTLT